MTSLSMLMFRPPIRMLCTDPFLISGFALGMPGPFTVHNMIEGIGSHKMGRIKLNGEWEPHQLIRPSREKRYPLPSVSVLNKGFDVIDYEHRYRHLSWLQFQPKLLF